MSEQRPRTSARQPRSVNESRLLPLSIAGLVCFFVAIILGYGGWYLFGTHEPRARDSAPDPVRQTPNVAEVTPSPITTPEPPRVNAPAGELPVPGCEVTLGGESTDAPLQRVFVKPFSVAETEVTNEQYREFVKASEHKSPAGWKEGDFPPGATLEPVTGVTWQDAADYCAWLSNEIGVEARLPTEAEWELVARGTNGRKYPWGEQWDARAADSVEAAGRVRSVKSFPSGKSPFGAYDMAGNVWEWTADEARDEEGRPKMKDGAALRIIKGGSAREPRAFVSATSRYEVAADKSSATLGFRYVVIRQRTP